MIRFILITGLSLLEGILMTEPRERYRYRVTYEKRQPYLSQIDILNVFRRTMRRADLPVSYSEGFNPQPLLSFGPALPVGFRAMAEQMEIRLDRDYEPVELAGILRDNLPPAIGLVGVRRVELKAPSINSSVVGAVYRFKMSEEDADICRRAALEAISSGTLPVTVMSKTGPQNRDQIGFLAEARAVGTDQGFCLELELRTSDGNLPNTLPMVAALAQKHHDEGLMNPVRIELLFKVLESDVDIAAGAVVESAGESTVGAAESAADQTAGVSGDARGEGES
ncbi:MAG: hypothetical protein CVV64_03680 [Candidatus Wallbacteria bacterium HGW-Wallbacteria-1]|jgi:radical SAM-linked protein|uniref:DUF2344 domain-containing protein n=1 Tax=Candidatus Wallbacteria bacterium HGW-Wallbacteria-1 TaxID=2013854 RepID=A0A2N1PTV5_9BACT|nr:MAG: hypothetical protein CVV64_03680 [Candidatus Wallbacteria bacterium HGW-Wallbacteria-1]